MTHNTSYHDKRRESRQLNRARPFRYVLVLTNLCNLRCNFCFQEKRYLEGSLGTEDWLEFIHSLPEGSHLTLTGGEPLVFKGFKKIVKNIPSHMTFNVITNGLLLSREISELLVSSPSFRVLSISIDDIGNHSRDFTSVQWQQLLDNIDTFRGLLRNHTGHKIVLDIKSVIHSGNYSNIINIASFTQSIGADTHMLMFVKGSEMQHSDRTYDLSCAYENPTYRREYSNIKLLEEQLNLVRLHALLPEVSTRYYLHPKLVDFYDDDMDLNIQKYVDQEVHDPTLYEPCRAPWESLHINNNGSAFPCLAFNAGNIRQHTLDEILSSKNMQAFKTSLLRCGSLPACKQCGYLQPLKGESLRS